MPDYVYLLENRLSPDQQTALRRVTKVARDRAMTVFLAGGAVRDFTSGSPVRDLDVSVQGNALKLQKDIEKAGGTLMGVHEPSQTLFFKFSGGARIEVSSTRTETFPKPGKPVYTPSSILDDLRRRDFTVNAMALSLNEGSYGLLLDPLNGQADIETRHLRLVSNYGFIEDPSRLVRAARLIARYGWTLEEKTQTRYDNAKAEDYIENIPAFSRGYELEELAHEEDPLKIVKHLEAEGWMKALFAPWTSAKADVEGLDELREILQAWQVQGLNPDASAANLDLLTAKLSSADKAALKKLMPRKGFVAEWDALDEDAKALSKLLLAKEANVPSAAWKLLTTYKPEAVLWLALTGTGAALQARFKNFFTVWPEARQRIPYTIMQEMRIVPELPGYQDLQRLLFLQFMDGNLQTEEEQRKFLEPYSPPAPPPPVSVRRAKPKKAEPKKKSSKAAKAEAIMAPPDAEVTFVEEAPAAEPAPVKKAEVKRQEPKKAEGKKPEPKKPEVKKPEKKAAAPAKKAAVKVPAKAEKKAAKKAAPVKTAKKVVVKVVAKKNPAAKPVAKKAPAKKPAPKAAKKKR
jgi:tRNA nucleotidyltransferase/poly(A) polymerase